MFSNTFNVVTRLLMHGALISGIVACNAGDNGSPSAAVIDTAAPTIGSTTPVASATSVARNSAITATFNEDIFAKTVDASSFTLTRSGIVECNFTFEGVENTATFTPNSDLSIHTTYTAILSSAITDVGGNPLSADYSWSFTTA